MKTSEAGIGFDRLVIALGAELAPGALPGFTDAAHNLYTLDGAAAAGEALRRFEGGRVAVAVSNLPYKCPAAPYEAAFLTEALLRHRQVHDTTIDIYTPVPLPGGKFLPKAGVFAEAQAKVVAANIAADLAGRQPTATFGGTGACFVELGDRRGAFATGNFYAPGGPQIRLRRPGPHWHLAKAAFEQYWLRRWL